MAPPSERNCRSRKADEVSHASRRFPRPLASLLRRCSSLPAARVRRPRLLRPGAYAAYTSYVPLGRPSTTAKVSIVSPDARRGDQRQHGPRRRGLTGATIVATPTRTFARIRATSISISTTPWYMQYSLTKDLPVTPGTHVLKAEFVANDHAPFNPRDWSTQVFFTFK